MTIEEARKKVEGVEGFLSDAEGVFLYRTAQRSRGRGVIVEIGSFKGRSTVWLGAGSLAGYRVPIFAVDPHISEVEHHGESSFEIFKKNIEKAGIKNMVTPIVAKSEDAIHGWNKPIEFLWIDGYHSYEAAMRDFRLWSPFVIDGGVVAFHDSTNDDVQRVVKETIFQGKGFRHAGMADSISYAARSNRIGWFDAVHTRYVAFLSWSYNPLRKLLPPRIRSVMKRPLKFILSHIQ